ncbi:MAG: redoxin domain-containing protein [Planctomycetes bacterium]|nr:redoxin domain-containing protein [Planctomycetota bacterium]
MNRRIAVPAAALCAVVTWLPAQAAKEIGDPAPSLNVGTWVKGGRADLAAGKGKNIYVIEFWATWCPPCLVGIPHLSEMQKKFRDKNVVFVGVSDEPASVVEPFVKSMGTRMDYIVASDNRGATGRAYMDAFGINGIPYAFVVDKNGVVTWHGHPDGDLETVLDRIVAGKFDIKAEKEAAQAARMAADYFGLVEKWNVTRDQRERERIAQRARQTGEAIVQKGVGRPELLNRFSWEIMLMPGIESRDLDLAARAAEAAYQSGDRQPSDKARKLMHDYFRSVQAVTATQPATDEARRRSAELGQAVVKTSEPRIIEELAWQILTSPALKDRDLNLALSAAEAANRLTSEQDPSVLDTYALALFKTGKREQAIDLAKKALALNKDERLEPHLKQALEEYQK